VRKAPADQTIPTPALREVRFGLVATTQNLNDPALQKELSTTLGPLWTISVFPNYQALVDGLGRGHIDLAWLSPLAYVRAASNGAADLVLTLERAQSPSYAAALVVRRDDRIRTLAHLANLRAAWVDPLSAAGYLMPRRTLRAAGLDPNTLFASQGFHGSHGAVIDAVIRRRADVCGTFCSVDAKGQIVRAAWSNDQPVRALAVSEPIPGDTICVSPRLGTREGRALAARLVSLAVTGANRPLLLKAFGADRFVPGNPDRYAALATALAEDESAKET
jgi:phosphate/phosphite/phosphonate ABC transporter binding protein